MSLKRITFVHLWTVLSFIAVGVAQPTTRPILADVEPAAVTAKGALLLHLPGIGGYRMCDFQMLGGLRDGGLSGNIKEVVYDWTENDPGIHALQAYDRNQKESQKIAEMIIAHKQADPTSPIYLTAHSGGCGLAIWALEKLPPDVNVQIVVLIAPALSPTYDLSNALRHVNGRMYAFSSLLDTIVLDTGTRMFGTIDGVQTQAAGYSGFIQPKSADPQLYKKLISHAYSSDWMRYGDYGDHIGGMSRRFSAAILAPLIVANSGATTLPSTVGETNDPSR
jgi:hypothetical protein